MVDCQRSNNPFWITLWAVLLRFIRVHVVISWFIYRPFFSNLTLQYVWSESGGGTSTCINAAWKQRNRAEISRRWSLQCRCYCTAVMCHQGKAGEAKPRLSQMVTMNDKRKSIFATLQFCKLVCWMISTFSWSKLLKILKFLGVLLVRQRWVLPHLWRCCAKHTDWRGQLARTHWCLSLYHQYIYLITHVLHMLTFHILPHIFNECLWQI